MVGGMKRAALCVSALPLLALGVLVTSGPTAADPAANGAATPVFTAIPWAQEKTPMPTTGRGANDFQAVSCPAANACEAVGWYENTTFVQFAMAGVWNGTAWKLQAVPKPVGGTQPILSGVSCTAATACVAVGSYTNSSSVIVPLAMVWNGTAWKAEKPPAPSGSTGASLSSVSCPAAGTCEAVGQNGLASLAESLSGTTWTVQTTPPTSSPNVDNELSGVSCPAVGACEAVGDAFNSVTSKVVLAERWNGTAWTVQTLPSPSATAKSFLSSVSCPTTGRCEATGSIVGLPGAPVGEKWNGKSWALQAMPGPSASQAIAVFFGQVSCSAATACDAMGYYSTTSNFATLVDAWNGTAWTSESAPSANDEKINGISCPPTGACQAVGFYIPGSISEPLALAGR